MKLANLLTAEGGSVFSPDGVRIDKQGNLFIALYNGGGFAVIGPNGNLIKRVELPGQHHSNLAITPDGQFIYATAIDDKADGSFRGQLLRVENPLAQ